MSDGSHKFAVEVIDVIKNGSLYLQIRERERDSWHKIWLYGFAILYLVMMILIVLVVKFSKEKRH